MTLSVKSFRSIVNRFPAAAGLYRHLRDRKNLAREVEYRSNLGFRFNGLDAMERGDFESKETKIFDAAIEKFDMFVNIGANTGYYALKALSRNKEVCAFEPNDLNGKILLRNVRANEFSAPFHFFPIALGDSPGILPLYGASTGASLIEGWAGQTTSVLVPVNTFDNTARQIINGKRCFVIIDIEGAELQCLRGSESLLNNAADVALIIEISVGEHQPKGLSINPNLAETFLFLFSKGYHAYTADDALREVEIDEVKTVASSGIDTLKTHNFLFLRKGRTLADVGLN